MRERMGTIGSIAVGAALGFAFMVAMAAANFARITRKPERPSGMELLEKGAAEWRPLASPNGAAVSRMWQGKSGKLLVSTATSPYGASWSGGKWETTTELPPTFPFHPTIADVSWRQLPDGTWLTARAGTCAPVLEPAKTVLPELPRCDKEKFDFRLGAATRTTDGSLLVLVTQEDGSSHAWKLAPGAAAWTDTGALPIAAVAATLVAGYEKQALVVGGDGAMARFDGERWTTLPRPKEARIGWEAALTEEGAVLAAGGFQDAKRFDATINLAIVVAFLAAAIAIARALKVGVVAMVFGAGFGVFAAIGAFLLLWILIGARF